MARIKSKMDALKEVLIILQETKKIEDTDLKESNLWVDLSLDYKEVNSAVDRGVVSIINSIMFQRRIIFCLETEFTRDLIRNDQNRTKKRGGLRDANYSAIIAVLTQSGLVQCIKKGGHMELSVYEVIDADLLTYLSKFRIDREKQLQETLTFLEQSPRKRKWKTVVSKKHSEDSNKNQEKSSKHFKNKTTPRTVEPTAHTERPSHFDAPALDETTLVVTSILTGDDIEASILQNPPSPVPSPPSLAKAVRPIPAKEIAQILKGADVVNRIMELDPPPEWHQELEKLMIFYLNDGMAYFELANTLGMSISKETYKIFESRIN